MNKIIKNNTDSDIFLDSIGRSVNANSQITIPVERYTLLSSEDSVNELTPLIQNLTVIINNGVKDLEVETALRFIKLASNLTIKTDSENFEYVEEIELGSNLTSTVQNNTLKIDTISSPDSLIGKLIQTILLLQNTY